ERQKFFRVGAKFRAAQRFERRGDCAANVRESKPNRLLAEIDAEQARVLRQQGLQARQLDDGCGHSVQSALPAAIGMKGSSSLSSSRLGRSSPFSASTG